MMLLLMLKWTMMTTWLWPQDIRSCPMLCAEPNLERREEKREDTMTKEAVHLSQ